MKPKNILVVYHVHNFRGLETVQRELHRHKIKFTCIDRKSLSRRLLKNRDLVIVVGGDGTFLRTTHLIDSIPVLLVSSDITHNEGFFARADRDDFHRKLVKLLKGKHKITKLHRLQGIINGKSKTVPCVNEVYVGSKAPYYTSRYWLEIGARKEYQKSSGVLIATGAGSRGWLKGAGGKPLPIATKKISFVVREPYKGRLSTIKITTGVISEKVKIKVTSDMYLGIVAVDSSSRAYTFNKGDKVEIKRYKYPLNFVEF